MGTAFVAASATAYGVTPIFAKIAYHSGAAPVGVLSLRFTIGGLALLGLAALRRERWPRGRQLAALAALGGIGYVAESLAYFLALTRVSAGLVALLLYAYPAMVVLLATVFLRERPRRATVGCLVLATAGTALTAGPVAGGAPLGVTLGLLSAASYAGYIVVSSRATRGLPPLMTSGVIMTAAAISYDVIAVAIRPALPGSGSGWAAVVGLALVCTVVAVAAFFAGLPRLGPSDTAVVSTLEPAVSVALAAVVLGEGLGRAQLVGAALVLVAVASLARIGTRRRPG